MKTLASVATFLALGEEERNADQHHGDAHWSPVFHGDDVWIVRPGGVQGLRPDMRGGREIGWVPSELAAVGLDGSTLIGVIDSSSSAEPSMISPSAGELTFVSSRRTCRASRPAYKPAMLDSAAVISCLMTSGSMR